MFCRNRNRLIFAALLAMAATPLAAQDLPRDPPGIDDLALMGTIPIYWGERDDLADLLAPEAESHWARAVIEARYRLRPLDYLSSEALSGHSRLLLAQPRGFSAEENVALDNWVRAGGHVLLFADPMMTGHSRFAIGDRRRPQDVALLSPILSHWGLELHYDEDQPEGRRVGDGVPAGLPVELAGQLTVLAKDDTCSLISDGIIALCRIGQGEILVVADAAVLDPDFQADGADVALNSLLLWIFGNPVH